MIIEEQNGRRVYSDGGTTEEQMLAIAKKYPERLAADYIVNSSAYTINNTFSPVRHNLLNWYPFKSDADILEVGAGMGSMTGLLCDVARSVTSVEMNQLRADVIRSRYPERKNLLVLSENINTWHTEQLFDYVVVVGVLEYAGVFGDGKKNEPFVAFLQSIRRLLKPGGVVLLAIENRFGLKYWLGGAEDHLQKAFVGIEGYKKEKTPKTFSKAELENVFFSSGFLSQRFYYVLPDYKFPTAIFTDDSFPSEQDILNVGFTYSPGSQLVGNERELYKDIISNGLFPNMANSYLVEAVCGDILPNPHVVRVNGRGEIKPQYRIITTIDSENIVRKKPADERALNHVENTQNIAENLLKRGVNHIDSHLKDGVLETKVVKFPLASEIFCDALNRGDWTQICLIIDRLQAALEKSSETTEQISPLAAELEKLQELDTGILLLHGYLDMTLYNAFWNQGELMFFDQEWDFEGLPLRFILYYGLKITYNRNKGDSLIPFIEILRYIGVSKTEAQIWNDLEICLWGTVQNRTGDVYGEDGYCNLYNEKMTLIWQQQRVQEEVEKAIADSEKQKLLLEEKEKQEHRMIAGMEKMRDEMETRRMERIQRQFEKKDHQIAQLSEATRRMEEMEREHTHLTEQQNRLQSILASRTWRYGQRLLRLLGRGKSGNDVATVATENAPILQDSVDFTGYTPLTVPTYTQPQVSIIIPVYNEFEYTYNCLKTILATCQDIPYEVIIGDDCSTDQTYEIEKIVHGLRVVHNSQNLRFLRNCNQAAQQANGEYLVFLNNDTLVQENWLQSMLEVMEKDSSVGMTGSKILCHDGKLQEAGGIIWQNGLGWNYGRRQDSSAPEFNYLKEVDYISGCSIMIRKSLWTEIGGFDDRYAPAYYEDVDLAFEVRKHGYKVIYQPLSVVVHIEGVSNGTDISEGQKKYQVSNRYQFIEKWKDVLEKDQYPEETHTFRARDRTKNKKTLLMIDHYVPTYDQDAGSRTIYEYIKLFMTKGYKVMLLPDNFYRSEPYTTVFQQMGVEVLYGPWYLDNWQTWVKDNSQDLDVVFLNRPHVSIHYIDFLRENTKARLLYYGMDLHFLREERRYEVEKTPQILQEVANWRIKEFYLMQNVDCSFFPSYVEEEYVRNLAPDVNVLTLPVFIFSNLKRKKYVVENRKDLMFVGGFTHLPNKDAMIWFVKEIFPFILAKEPSICLHILGSNAPDEIKALAGSHVQVHGFVSNDELEKYYATCRISVAPLRFGAGIKGKVIEAMGEGIPVITTHIGAEGIYEPERFLAVEDTAEDFAQAVCKLYNNANSLHSMVENAYDYIENTFGEKNASDIIDRALKSF